MDLAPYVESIRSDLLVAADAGGDEARALGERLIAPLESAFRLALQDALAAAAEEITCELAPGSVEVRLRGRDPEFVVTPPPVEGPDDEPSDHVTAKSDSDSDSGSGPDVADDGAMARINLRMPDHLKARVEQAAGGEGASVNSWLVRAAVAALDRNEAGPRNGTRIPTGARRYTGWAR